MIRVTSLTKEYRDGDRAIKPLEGVDFSCKKGEFILITGRSGSGKTTFLNVLGGLTRPTSGTVMVDGMDLYAMTDAQRAAVRSATTGFVFQFPGLLSPLTALENVILPVVLQGHAANMTGRGHDLLIRMGLENKAGSLPSTLSGGELKRVAIARALISNPRLILADEPTADLDEETEREVMELFREIHASGTTIIMVTHNRELAPYASRVMRMDQGTLAEPQD
ncbi:MAG: ABC transporter ATP-binding protein [Methanoregula sp.]